MSMAGSGAGGAGGGGGSFACDCLPTPWAPLSLAPAAPEAVALAALLLRPLAGHPAPLDVLDVCCASGRGLVALKALGHCPVGLDGAAAAVAMARPMSGCEVWQQDLTYLRLPPHRFDAVFCNVRLFHVPFAELPDTLAALRSTLRPGGVLFASIGSV